MTEFGIIIPASMDQAKVLAHVLGFYGSLRAPRELWATALGSMGWTPWYVYLQDAASTGAELSGSSAPWEAITIHAVPEEGELDPVRAKVMEPGWFITPTSQTSISVALEPLSEERARAGASHDVHLYVRFGRDSRFAAMCLLARLAEHGVREAAGMLSRAAQEVAEEEAARPVDYGY